MSADEKSRTIFHHGYDYDIAISYTHVDNAAPHHWVRGLANDLRTRIQQVTGKSITVWLDNRLEVGTRLAPTIFKTLDNSALLLPILSPSYPASLFCMSELAHFLDAQRSRSYEAVVPVIKYPLPDIEVVPPEIRSLLDCRFYRLEDDSGLVREYFLTDPIAHNLQVDALAQAIARKLAQAERLRLAASERRVFVSWPSPDAIPQRETICKILRQNGLDIVAPSQQMLHAGASAEALRQSLASLVSDVVMSVNILGQYSRTLAGGENVDQLQMEVVFDAAPSSCQKLAWVAPAVGLESPDPPLLQTLNLFRGPYSNQGLQLVERSYFEFEAHVLDLLPSLRKPQRLNSPPDAPLPPAVYMMHDPADEPKVAKLAEIWQSLGYCVDFPPDVTDPESARQIHEEFLCANEVLLVFFGDCTRNWFQAKIQELRRLAGRRSKPLLGKVIYLDRPDRPEKHKIMQPGFELVNGLGAEDPKPLMIALHESLSTLKQAVGQ